MTNPVIQSVVGSSQQELLSSLSAKSLKRPVVVSLMNGNGGSFVANNTTLAQMIMMPTEFIAIRIGYAHRGGSGPVTAARLLVATTDNVGDLSQAQTSGGRQYVVPTKNGVADNTISATGWRQVTFSGGADLNVPDAGANNLSFVWSDLIQIQAEPLRFGDTARFAGCYPLIFRFFAGTAQYTKGGNTGFGDTTSFIPESGKYLQLGCARAGEFTVTPSGWNETSTVAFGDDKSLPIIVEAYTAAGRYSTVLCCGDSRFASCSEFPSKMHRNLQQFIEQQSAFSETPFRSVSLAQGGQTTNVYYQRGDSYLAGGGYADASLYLVYSINDGTPTKAIMDNAKAKAILFADRCRRSGVRPVLVTAFPLGTGYTTEQVALLNDLVSFVSSLGYPFINPLAIYSGNANYGWNPIFQFDNSHMNDAGYQDLAARCLAILRTST